MAFTLIRNFKVNFHWDRDEIMPWYYAIISWPIYWFVLKHVCKRLCDIKSSKISTAYDVWFSRYRPSNLMLAKETSPVLVFINFLWAVYIYIWFNFPEGRKAGIFFVLLIHPEVTWSVSHTSTRSKLWEAWALPPSVASVKGNGVFRIAKGPSPSMVNLWKTALQT